MDKTLQDALASLITRAVEAAERGGEFLAGQLPDYVQQLLRWNLVEHSVYAGVWFLLITVVMVLWRLAFKFAARVELRDRYTDGPDVARAVSTVISPILLFVFGSHLVTNVVAALKIYLAPKVWLVEYAAGLAGGK